MNGLSSLDATPTLKALGLPPYDEGKNEKKVAQRAIEVSTQRYTSEDLDKMIRDIKQAGSPCLTRAEFLASSHVRIERERTQVSWLTSSIT